MNASQPLVVGVDIRDLKVAKTGTKTYLEEICKAFAALNDPTVQLCFLNSPLPAYQGSNKVLKWLEHLSYQLWKQVILPFKAWRRRCKVVFCTDNFAPLIKLGYETVPVFHDAFFFETPEHYGKLWLKLYKITALPAARKSALIITPTYYAKKQIQRYTGIPGHKLAVVYEGPKALTQITPTQSKLDQQFPVQPKSYLLHVGTLFKRKNIPLLIDAFNRLKSTGKYPDLSLVLAGQFPTVLHDNDSDVIKAAIEQSDYKNQIILTGYVDDEQLAFLYQHALLYVFPSVNEGFGIPVLEAFAYGLPVLVANNTCLPEVGGDAVITFNPFNSTDLCTKIDELLSNAQLRSQLTARGYKRLQEFSWKKAAYQLVTLFKQAVGQPK